MANPGLTKFDKWGWGPLHIEISEATREAWKRLRPVPGSKQDRDRSARSLPTEEETRP